MKLVRYGASGQEKPGLIDSAGKLRDLSAHVSDLAGAALKSASLAKLKALSPESLPLVDGSPRDIIQRRWANLLGKSGPAE